MIDILGYITTLCFGLSSLPLALEALRNRRISVPWGFLYLVLAGSLSGVLYSSYIGATPLILSYGITLISFIVVWRHNQ